MTGSAPLETALDRAREAIDHSDVSQDLALSLGVLEELVKVGVVRLELLDKLVARGDVGEGVGDERFGDEGGVAVLEGREGGKGRGGGGEQSGENGELAADVGAREVVGGVGLLRDGTAGGEFGRPPGNKN